MSKTGQPDRMRQASRQRAVSAWRSLALVLLPLLAGCGTTASTHSGDPLYGEYYPKGPNGQPMPPPNPNAPKTTALGVPPYPLNNSASSTAAIASNSAPLGGGRPLAINEKSGIDWTLTSGNNPSTAPISGQVPPPISRGGPVVQPIPRDNAVPGPVGAVPAVGVNANNGSAIIATGSWSSGTPAQPSAGPVPPLGMTTPDVLLGTLQGKGAIGLKQENVPEGLRVSCYAPQRSNPANLRYLETVAPDYSTALQALLQQIDQ